MKEYLDIIIKAKESTNEEELHELSKNVNFKVRRAVAKNKHTSQKTLATLQKDPALNVAFIANIHAINKVIFDDEIALKNPCVICEKDETTFHHECGNCREDSYSRIMDGFIPYGKEKIKYSY
ncbi:hypothetical protein [Arcobacter sp.]|uniref:hypothetical protein n=1 Tax=Arcobacter sp. TaxID=1872629 RepID=UPI003D0BEC33